MAQWLAWSLSAAFLWGLWGFFSKLAMRDATPIAALFYFVTGQTITAVAMFVWNRHITAGISGAAFGVASGVAGLLATLAFFTALRHAAVAVVLPLTALYPVVAIALGVLVLGEKMTVSQAAGAVLAVAAVVLLSR